MNANERRVVAGWNRDITHDLKAFAENTLTLDGLLDRVKNRAAEMKLLAEGLYEATYGWPEK